MPIIEAIEALPASDVLPSDDAIEVTDTAAPDEILTRPDALAIAKKINSKVTGQNIYNWCKAALTSKSDDAKQSNRQKLADVGLAPAKSGSTFAWTKL